MGEIIALILIVVAIYLFVVYVLPIIAAVAGIAALIVAIVAVAIGGFSAVKNYVLAIKQEMNFKEWTWEADDEPAVRSYFFGPGFVQLKNTIVTAFKLNSTSGKTIALTAASFRGNPGWLGIAMTVGSWLYQIVASICVYGIGTALCAVLGAVHGSITLSVMVVTYVIFTVVWLIDRIYLQVQKIRSDCPVCKGRYLIPHFACPKCGEIHKKLVPGPYGIWKHTCSCGEKIPCTFLNGRSKLEAFCPDCGAPLVASDARPVVFQLIGGSKSGKTVFLSAFFHEYLRKLRSGGDLTVSVSDQYRPYFDDLEQWYQGVDCPSTAQRNSQMYPVLIDSKLGVRRQFSIYDIAGEMFDGFTAENEVQQQQFHYCDGLIFLIDPFSCGKLRSSRIKAGEDMSDFSSMAAADVAANFINYLISTGHAKANTRCNIPLSVVIAKSDIREVKRVVGPARLRSVMRNNPDLYATPEQARDEECRRFLTDIGLSSTVDNLEAQFTTIHYFPVSAMGHSPDGSEYEPWGVVDAVEWMLPLADKELYELIVPPVASQN